MERKEKLTAHTSMMDMLMIMSEGNPGALNVLMQMINDPRDFMDILLCDSLDIRGSKLYMLNNDCCGRDINKFKRTLMMLRSGVFTDKQIHQNLELAYAIPFIDDNIKIEGIPPYGKDFGPTHEKWEEFCEKNKESFIERLEEEVKMFEGNKPTI